MLIAISLLAGCASITVDPPQEKKIETSRSYSRPYEDVWLKAVEWFADHNVIIDKIEKTSGLITAKYVLTVSDPKYLDPGNIKVSGTQNSVNFEQYGSLNVTVRQLNENHTKASVNFFGTWELTARDVWDGGVIQRKGKSVSTGLLEASILDYIGSE